MIYIGLREGFIGSIQTNPLILQDKKIVLDRFKRMMYNCSDGGKEKQRVWYNIYMGVTYIYQKTRGLVYILTFKGRILRHKKREVDIILPPRLYRHYSILFASMQPQKSMLL